MNFFIYVYQNIYAVILGLITSLLGVFICWLCKRFIDNLREKSDFNGKWMSRLYDSNDVVVKQDITYVKHNRITHWLHGEINRQFPNLQEYRQWHLDGLLLGDIIICLVWSEQSIASVCCALLHLEDDYFYEGKYLRYNYDNHEIACVKIDLQKINA